jgi:L-threonylcarbamoyladenylate synthase
MGPGVADAARALGRGALVVYPTDTLWGLGARATDARAVDRLLRAKGRASDSPVSVAVSSVDELDRWARLGDEARAWARRNLPGPYTLLALPSIEARRRFPAPVVRSGGRVGIRVPDHPVARELARRVGPIVATSANQHGEPPAADTASARRVFGHRVAVYLDAAPAPSGRPSTLVDVTGPRPREVARGRGHR